MKFFLFSLVFIFAFSVSAIDPTEKQTIVPESKVTKSHVKTFFLDGGSVLLAVGAGAGIAGYIVSDSALMLAGGGVMAVGGGIKLCAAAFRKK